jgi:DNA-binding transcriptional regulator YhcF (GntR family)
MIIELDDDSKDPPFTQIKTAITRLIASGELVADTRLPTIRQLAGDLDLAPNTVARAYRELEADGLVRSSGRRGTVIARVDPARAAQADPAVASTAADDFVRRARHLGLDAAAILALVSRSLARDV